MAITWQFCVSRTAIQCDGVSGLGMLLWSLTDAERLRPDPDDMFF
jgi:hypothetical protein